MTKDEELQDFAERLNGLCDEKGVPPKGKARQSAMAKLFEVSQNAARKWLEGEGYPTIDKAKRIARWAGVTFDWLMTGLGPKSLDALYGSPAVAHVANKMQSLPPEQQAIAQRMFDQVFPDPDSHNDKGTS